MDEYKQIIEYVFSLFTPSQKTILIFTAISVMTLIMFFKKIYFPFSSLNKSKKEAVTWLAALVIGACAGVSNYYVAEPQQPLWFNLFTSVVAGGLGLGLSHIFSQIIWPKIKAIPLFFSAVYAAIGNLKNGKP